MKGQPPKSAARKALQGNTGRRKKAVPVAEAESAPAENPPQIFFSDPWAAPEWLPDGARKIWAEHLPIARLETKLQLSGLHVFACYCDAVYRLQKYTRLVEEQGATYTTASGYIRKRPEVELRDRAANDVRNFAGELNLTPKSWIGSMGTFAGRQLDMFMNGGRPSAAPSAPKPQEQTAAPAASEQPKSLRDFRANRPTLN